MIRPRDGENGGINRAIMGIEVAIVLERKYSHTNRFERACDSPQEHNVTIHLACVSQIIDGPALFLVFEDFKNPVEINVILLLLILPVKKGLLFHLDYNLQNSPSSSSSSNL